ncbi:30S ribosomal protein S9 [Leucobacter weissii]|uniref:Small ribosomal subunit protein uS9 n=1 Tax=Leucobacter weissii TaxID=1983706 RepID=A0A939SD61_9MICO|nr:30S ribosomal protein S9 [Leucobacter weissii]
MTEENVAAESYTTETPADQAPASTPRPALTVPGAAVGRRKQAIARVRLVPGSGAIKVNGREFADYFPNKLHQQLITDPFTVLELGGAYDVTARIIGGGPSGQAGALRLAIARALNEIDAEHNRPKLKKAGFLSRDARIKERKKAGLKKARKAPQYSKR